MNIFRMFVLMVFVCLTGALSCRAAEAGVGAKKVEQVNEIKGEELESVKSFLDLKGLTPVSHIYKFAYGKVLRPPGAIRMLYADARLAELRVKEDSVSLYGITPAVSEIRKLGNQVVNKNKNEITAEMSVVPQYVGVLGRAEPVVVPPKADNTPPRTYAAFTIPGYKEHYSASAQIFLDPWDPPRPGYLTSGVDKVWYSVDKKDGAMGRQLYVKQFQLAEGKHTLYFRGVDKAGNFEVLNSSPIYVDGTAPRTSISVVGSGRVDGTEAYVAAGSSIAFSSVDPESNGVTSGIGMIMFSPFEPECHELTAKQWSRKPGVCPGFMYTGPFALPAGVHTVYYGAMDNTGNMEKPNKIVVTFKN